MNSHQSKDPANTDTIGDKFGESPQTTKKDVKKVHEICFLPKKVVMRTSVLSTYPPYFQYLYLILKIKNRIQFLLYPYEYYI